MQNETKHNFQIQPLKWHSEFTQLHVSLIQSDIVEYKKSLLLLKWLHNMFENSLKFKNAREAIF